MRRLAAVVLTGAFLVTGCSVEDTPSDPLQVAATLYPATPAASPATTTAPVGQVLPSGAASALAVTGTHLAVALTDPPSVALYPLAGGDPLTAALPGPVESLVVDGADVLAPVPGSGVVVTVRPDASTTSQEVGGAPVDVARVGGKLVVARREAKDLDLGGRTMAGFSSPDRVLAFGDKAIVLDRPRSAVFDVDPAAERPGAGLRAGEGATNAVADRYGRVLVVDTRGGEFMAFSSSPLIMRQRYPLPGAPYGLAYDERTDLAWITLTERNEVVAFDVAGGEPKEVHRYATVRQPDSVAVDPETGRVYVASAGGEGVQVIEP
ncbi:MULTISPECIES: hypothetical protein [Actinosynnema]|uniref:YncE family protein n=1 Tax=Actinosynnema TaxID=40566 RepID=UPI0020A3B4C8|nr:hypothetical protein [Actinosynnema pretiosum]MCP2096263.1 hypothetical protein [Actinosynnema pretiosum]